MLINIFKSMASATIAFLGIWFFVFVFAVAFGATPAIWTWSIDGRFIHALVSLVLWFVAMAFAHQEIFENN
jgi:hypothetical protein